MKWGKEMNKPRDIVEQLGEWASYIQEVAAVGIKETSFAERILKAELLDESKIEYVPWTDRPMLRLDDDLLLVVNTVGMSRQHPIDSVTDSLIPDIADEVKVIAEGLDEGFLELTADRIAKYNGLCTSRKSEDMLMGDFTNLFNLLDNAGVGSHVTLMHKHIFNKVLSMFDEKQSSLKIGDGEASMNGRNMVVTIKEISQLAEGNVYVFGAPEQLGRYFVSKPKVVLGVTPNTFKVDVEVLTARKWGNVDAVGKSYIRNEALHEQYDKEEE